jgi:hypothetical protein
MPQGGAGAAGGALDAAGGGPADAALLLRLERALRGGRDRLAAVCRVGADDAAQLRKVGRCHADPGTWQRSQQAGVCVITGVSPQQLWLRTQQQACALGEQAPRRPSGCTRSRGAAPRRARPGPPQTAAAPFGGAAQVARGVAVPRG